MISIANNRYTNLYSAVTFLENVQHDSLTISEEEFTKGMQEAKMQMQEAKEMARRASQADALVAESSLRSPHRGRWALSRSPGARLSFLAARRQAIHDATAASRD